MPDHLARCFLVSCVSRKVASPRRAKELYISDWFVKARQYVELSGSPWFILSAEYGLVNPETVIAPYERTLNRMGVIERRAWAQRVVSQMKVSLPKVEEIVVLAGMRYREFLMPFLQSWTPRVVIPLEGLRIGEQLSWLGKQSTGTGGG